jgi:hypothetical protein
MLYFVRAGEVDCVPDLRSVDQLIVAAAGSVRLRSACTSNAIFACGDVRFAGEFSDLLIVSGGDVICGAPDHPELTFHSTVIVARGNVTCYGRMTNSRVISGKAVGYDEKRAVGCDIVQNNVNPFAFR